MSSGTGDAWRSFYQSGDLTWYKAGSITSDYLIRHAASEWIHLMSGYTDLKPSHGTRVLEAGCGTAMFGLSLAILGFSVDAFDYNDEALVLARDLQVTARSAKPDLQIRLTRGDLISVESESNVYDLVFNQAVLDYFCEPEERAHVLAEMVRVARPGGWVAVIVQHTGHPFRRVWERLGWRGYDHQPPTAIQTPARMASEFEQAGLESIIVDGIYPWKAFFFYPPWYRLWKWSENLVYLFGQFLNRLVPMPRVLRRTLALQILVMGRKP